MRATVGPDGNGTALRHLPIVYHPEYVTRLPDGHRFPMPKFRRVYELLCSEGIATERNVYRPEAAGRELLSLVHSERYLREFLDGSLPASALRRIGLPWSEALTRRTRRAVGGTLLTARLALRHGLACNVAGGTHHAHPEFGSGFCIFNDLAVAARALLAEGRVRRVLIVDLDVHQGDGTAAAFLDEPAVFTFSMHCESNFPFRKVDGDLDIGLANGLGDEAYIERLQQILPGLLETQRPELVLYDAGADVHQADRLGRLMLTNRGLFERDRYVIELCRTAGVPVAAVIGGGYDQDLDALADRHCMLHRAACEVVRRAAGLDERSTHSQAPHKTRVGDSSTIVEQRGQSAHNGGHDSLSFCSRRRDRSR